MHLMTAAGSEPDWLKWCVTHWTAHYVINVMVCVYFDVPLRLLRLCYVQSLTGHKSPVTAVSASETTGDIATVCDSGDASLSSPKVLLMFGWKFGSPVRLTIVPLRPSGRRQRPAAVDRQRRPDRPRALPGDHLLGGLLQPAGGRVGQRDRRRPGERRGQVGVASTLYDLPELWPSALVSHILFFPPLFPADDGPGCGARGI